MQRELTSAVIDRISIAVLPADDVDLDDRRERLNDIADRADVLLDRIDIRGAEEFLQSTRQRSAE